MPSQEDFDILTLYIVCFVDDSHSTDCNYGICLIRSWVQPSQNSYSTAVGEQSRAPDQENVLPIWPMVPALFASGPWHLL